MGPLNIVYVCGIFFFGKTSDAPVESLLLVFVLGRLQVFNSFNNHVCWTVSQKSFIDLWQCFLSFWGGMGVFTPQLQIPIITPLDQQQHTEWAQWWVQKCPASVESPVVSCVALPHTWHTASVDRPVCTEEDTTASLRTETGPSGVGGWRLICLSSHLDAAGLILSCWKSLSNGETK